MKEEVKKFAFVEQIHARFQKWTGITDETLAEALSDISGDTHFEMRKLISVTLSEVERIIAEGMYSGYINGVKMTEVQRKNLKGNQEDLKEFLKGTIEATWRSILNKQKVGIDKLGFALRPYLKNDGN